VYGVRPEGAGPPDQAEGQAGLGDGLAGALLGNAGLDGEGLHAGLADAEGPAPLGGIVVRRDEDGHLVAPGGQGPGQGEDAGAGGGLGRGRKGGDQDEAHGRARYQDGGS
jgi:hypothetical protein